MNAPPRQIYASTLSRRQRAWGGRRRRRGFLARARAWTGWLAALAVTAAGTAALVLGHLPG